jgi:acid phosphatase type 7
MKTNIVKLALLVFAGILSALFNEAQAVTNKYRLTLRADPATTVVIGWNQASGSDGVVYYGPVDKGTNWSAYPSSKTVDRSVYYKGMNNRFARLTGLQPNTAYYFVIRDSDGTSQRFWFKTLPNDPSQRLSIIAGGDSRNNRTPRQNANKLVAKLRPHVVMFGGDMTNTSTDTEWSEWFDDWQYTNATDGRMFPVIAARGNHESGNSDISNLFDVPTSTIYYALNLGGTLVRAYTLNSETSIAGTQTSWLSNDLAANSNVTWKIAQYHRPMRPHASYKGDGVDQYNYWAPLFKQHNVKLVVESDAHTVKTTWPIVPSTGSGSDEGFVRDDENGTVYVGEGCWGAPLRQADDNKNWTRNSGMFNHFNWIFIDQNKIEIRTVNVDNSSSVGSLTDANIFAMPPNINIWTPSNGALISISNTGSSSPSPSPSPTPSTGTSVTTKISSGSNDVEETQNGSVYMTSSDIELVNDGATNGNQTVGLRFTGINVPKGATITNAYMQFTANEPGSTSTNVTIKGENADNSASFTTAPFNVSSRVKTTATVSWTPASWTTAGHAGIAQRTPDLKAIVQQIVSRTGWSAGNALSLIITGTGKRTAYAYEGSSSNAPKLVIEYSVDGLTPPPAAPILLSSRINSGSNDIEQVQNGGRYANSSDLELVNDGTTNGNQTVGLRFTGLAIPKGVTITNAYVQFVAKEAGSTTTSLVIKGENTDNSAAFSGATNELTLRPKTAASISWSPSAWIAEAGSTAQRTPDIKTIVQQIVNRSGWVSGNSITLIITGTGKRTAYAYEGSSSKAPQLVIEYTMSDTSKELNEELNEDAAAPVIEVTEALPPEMLAFPNPFSDEVFLRITANRPPEEKLKIEVYDITGKLCLRKEEEWVKDESIKLKTHMLSAGQYIIVTEYNRERLVQKVVKY